MDENPDAGGLGVKMIDGKGNFLPESKRGLPTPFVALSKMLGLSKLFPKSKIFNQYHLGYLDNEKICWFYGTSADVIPIIQLRDSRLRWP